MSAAAVTLTFTAEQLIELEMALDDRVEKLEGMIEKSKNEGDSIFWSERIVVVRQALDMLQGR